MIAGAKSLLGMKQNVAFEEERTRGPQRRHLPAQAGSFDDRRDAGALSRLETESAEHVIEEGLWKYHRLLPPSEDSPRMRRYESMLRIFLYYTSIWMPLRISFFGSLAGPAWQVMDGIDIAIDVCFWVDIAMTLRKCYYHKNELVFDWEQIVRRYLRFWFWVDVTANFPWELVFSAIGVNSIYFKVVRLARSFRLFKVKKQATAQSASRKLSIVIGLILFLCHWIACLWWLVGNSSFNLTMDYGHSVKA